MRISKTFLFFIIFVILYLISSCNHNIPTDNSEPVLFTQTISGTTINYPTITKELSTPSITFTQESTPTLFVESSNYLVALAYGDGANSSQGDLYLINTLDGSFTQLTDGFKVGSFSWSPDGQRIVFSALFDQYDYDLYVINADGTGLIELDSGLPSDSQEGSPSWSPDGKKIAFTQSAYGKLKIYIMEVDGSETYFLVEGNEPSWSPDGKSIAFNEIHGTVGYGELYLIKAIGGEQIRLTSNLFVKKPIWTPDGSRLFVLGYKLGVKDSLGMYAIDIDGSNIELIADAWEPPSWSVNGQNIVFSRNKKLYTIDIATRKTDRICCLPEFLNYIYGVYQPVNE